jgi:hypothetical protein
VANWYRASLQVADPLSRRIRSYIWIMASTGDRPCYERLRFRAGRYSVCCRGAVFGRAALRRLK